MTITFVFITSYEMHFFFTFPQKFSQHLIMHKANYAKREREHSLNLCLKKDIPHTHTHTEIQLLQCGGQVVTVTNPCPHHLRYFPDSSCPWGCWRASPSSWRETASLHWWESPYCCASSQNDRWVSPHDPRTRMDLSLDLDTHESAGTTQ